MSQFAKSDEELAFMAQAGNRDAERSLLARYAEKVKHIVRDFPVPGVDFEDREAEGTIGLLKAVRRYDPKCGTMFRTFAKQCVIKALVEVWRRANRANAVPYGMVLSIDAETEETLAIIESLAAEDDTAAEAIGRIEYSGIEDATVQAITDAIVLSASGESVLEGTIRTALERFALLVMGASRAADLRDLLGDPDGQLVLVYCGAERGTEDARRTAVEVASLFTATARRIIELTLSGVRLPGVVETLHTEGLPLDRRTVSKIVAVVAESAAA